MDAKKYLFSGITMSAELDSNFENERRFITIGGYVYINGKSYSITKYRKAHPINNETIKFYFHIYSIPNYFLTDDLDIHENDCTEYVYVGDISDYVNLEYEIKRHIPEFDFNKLIPIWKTNAPM